MLRIEIYDWEALILSLPPVDLSGECLVNFNFKPQNKLFSLSVGKAIMRVETRPQFIEINNNDLILKAQQGDVQSFGQLFYFYGKILLDQAYGITGNLEDAKDITQETYLKANKYIKSYDLDRSFKNWIYKININLCLDLLRKRRKQFRSSELAFKDKVYVPSEENPASFDFMDSLMKCMKFLNPKEKIVFILRDMEGMSVEEVAQVLNSSQGMVKYRLRKARRDLKERITNFYPYF